MGHQLHQALPVPEVQEEEPPEVATAVHPALEDHLLAHVFFPEASSVVGAAHNPLKLTGFSCQAGQEKARHLGVGQAHLLPGGQAL